MRNLKKIILKDSRRPGIGTNTTFDAPSLAALRAYFLVSDATVRVFSCEDSPSDDGFFTMLRALAATGAKINMLVTERQGLLKRGLSFREFSRKSPFSQEYVRGSGQLRKVSLCVDDNREDYAGDTIRRVGEALLSACTLAATKLEHLELSLTRRRPYRRTLPLNYLLPHKLSDKCIPWSWKESVRATYSVVTIGSYRKSRSSRPWFLFVFASPTTLSNNR